MPSKNHSPYASSFKTAMKRGTPCSTAVGNIAKRCGKSTDCVFDSLYKAGLCYRQKFNGQWVYWPCDCNTCTSATCKSCQWNMWQCFIDWCIASGYCTPEQLNKHCSSQKDFMSYCRKFFNKQFVSSTGTKFTKSKKRSTATYVAKTVSSHKHRSHGKTKTGTYGFPRAGKRRTTRRYRKAA